MAFYILIIWNNVNWYKQGDTFTFRNICLKPKGWKLSSLCCYNTIISMWTNEDRHVANYFTDQYVLTKLSQALWRIFRRWNKPNSDRSQLSDRPVLFFISAGDSQLSPTTTAHDFFKPPTREMKIMLEVPLSHIRLCENQSVQQFCWWPYTTPKWAPKPQKNCLYQSKEAVQFVKLLPNAQITCWTCEEESSCVFGQWQRPSEVRQDRISRWKQLEPRTHYCYSWVT